MTRPNRKLQEARILESLCKLIPNARFIDTFERPDGVIMIGNARAGVELATYTDSRPEVQRYRDDWRLRDAIFQSWVADERVWPFSVRLKYLKDQARRPRVPKPHTQALFIEELCAAVRHYGPLDTRDTDLVFQPRELIGDRDVVHHVLPAQRQIATCRWPRLAEHCPSLLIHRHIHDVGPLIPMSELDAGHPGCDVQHIERTIGDHSTSAPSYRSRLPEAMIWLVIHSDGYPLSRMIHESHLPRALQAARSALSNHGSVFDAAFWLDNPGAQSGGRLHPLTESATRYCP